MNKKLNILVILTDQQSSTMMSCENNQYVNTPNMDLLAQEGVKFNNAYCANPVCMPSRFSLMTGLYPSVIGLRSNDVSREVKKEIPSFIFENGIGTLLRNQGYRSIYAGKEHLPNFNAKDLGFDYICENERNVMGVKIAEEIRNNEQGPFFIVASFINPHDICLMAIRDYAKTCPEHIGNELIKEYTEEISYVELMEEKGKSLETNKFWNELCPPLPDNYEIAIDEPEAIDAILEQKLFKKHAREKYSDRDWRIHRWVYAQLTNQVDKEIGQVLKAVKEKDIWDDTIIIFTSDHGDMDGAHKLEHKTVLYEEATHIPMIIKDCNKSKGISPALINNGLDLIPTIMDYAGLEKLPYMEGHSIRSVVEDVTEIVRTHMLVESEFGKMIVNPKGCYQIYDMGENAEQYFDRKSNQGQMYNQVSEEKFQDEIEYAKKLIDTHKEYLKFD